MKKNKLLSVAMIAALFVVACKKNEKIETVDTTESVAPVETTNNIETTPKMEEMSTDRFEGDGISLTATYLNDQNGNMSVRIHMEEKIYELPQTEAWAKGAIYKKDNVEFENKGQINEAELKIDGKVYKLKRV